MTEDEQLLFQRQSGRLAQAETWLGILIAHFGTRHPFYGAQVMLSEEQSQAARQCLTTSQIPAISIDYDLQTGVYTLDAL